MAAVNYSTEEMDRFINQSVGAPSPVRAAGFPVVAPNVQNARDVDRQKILAFEYYKNVDDLAKATTPRDRTLYQSNIDSLIKEIGGVPRAPATPLIPVQSAAQSAAQPAAQPTTTTTQPANQSPYSTSSIDQFIATSMKESAAPTGKSEAQQLAEAQKPATVNPNVAAYGVKKRATVQKDLPIQSVGELARALLQNVVVAPVAAGAGIVGGLIHTARTGEAPGQVGEQIRQAVTEQYGYTPPSKGGQEMLQAVTSIPAKVLGSEMGLPPVTGIGPAAVLAPAAIRQVAPTVVKVAQTPVPGVSKVADFVADVKSTRQLMADQFAQKKAIAPTAVPETGLVSAGAAATELETSIKSALANSKPEIQEMFKSVAPSQYTPETLKAIENHNQFAKFDMTPTEGQALENTSLMSREMNDRLKDANLQKRFESQQIELVEAFNKIKQKIAPDVYETDPVKMANMPLEKMKADMVSHEQRISDAYDTANNATGTGQSAIDVAGLKSNIDQALQKKGKTKYLPAELRGDLEDALKKGFLTSEEYENFRTDTATIARTNPNTLARQAASIVREQLENVPLKGEFAKYKPLYDQARKLVVELKEKEKIPAYKAAASDTRTLAEIELGIPHPAANTFLERHYGEKTPEVNIKRMLDIIGKDSPEHQALNAAKVDQFKLRSGIKNDQGKVSQAALNKIIFETHKSNLPAMFGNLTTKELQDLAEVARKTESVKGVHAVNVSGTEIVREQNAAIEAAKTIGTTAVEVGLAKATGGASTVALPVLKGMFKSRQEKAAAAKLAAEQSAASERRLKPTAGINIRDMIK